MWDLYKEYESEFENQSIFNPPGDLAALTPAPAGPVQMPLPGNPQVQMAMMGQAAVGQPVELEYTLVHAMIESRRLSSKMTTRRRYRMFTLIPAQPVIQEDVLEQGWTHSPVPQQEPESQQRSSSPVDVQAGAGERQGKTVPQTQSGPEQT